MNDVLQRLETVIAQRLKADASSSYVAALGAKGQDQILKKVAEEAVETVIASKTDDKATIVHEVADLWFHCMVMLGWHGIALSEVMAELERREGRSGLDERASRTKGNP